MEITKQNESFIIKDDTGTYLLQGCATYSTSGSISINFDLTQEDGSFVGHCNYDTFAECDRVNFAVDGPKEIHRELITYTQGVIDQVIGILNPSV